MTAMSKRERAIEMAHRRAAVGDLKGRDEWLEQAEAEALNEAEIDVAEASRA